MIKNGKTYLTYEGYEDRYGMKTRPALVRYEEKSYQEHPSQEPIYYVSCTIYIDGKSFTNNINGIHKVHTILNLYSPPHPFPSECGHSGC